jgi:hypothetical protein
MTNSIYNSCSKEIKHLLKTIRASYIVQLRIADQLHNFRNLFHTKKLFQETKTRRNCNIQEFILYLSNYRHWQTEVLEKKLIS